MKKMNLEKIVKESRIGCITDYEEIARLTDRMGNLFMKEIIDTCDNRTKNNIKTMTDQIFKNYNLDKSVLDILRFKDLLCMINGTNDSKLSFQYVEDIEDGDSETLKTLISKMAFQYSCMDCLLEMLLKGAERNPLLQLYSCISAESFINYVSGYDYMDNFEFEDSVEDTFLYGFLKDSIEYMSITITPETTIKALLIEARNATWRCWRPHLSIENYCVQMLKPYGVVNVLTVGCFQMAYWGHFSLNEVLNKYHHYKQGFYWKKNQENYENYERR